MNGTNVVSHDYLLPQNSPALRDFPAYEKAIAEILGAQDSWELYMGNLWCQALEVLQVVKCGTVVEVAPGKANKIGNGLANYGFEGTLYVIEPDATALEVLLAKYKKILPAAHLIGIAKPLHEAKEILRDVHIDALLANHPLDDMVVANTLDSKEFVNLFEVEYGGEEVHTGAVRKEFVKKPEVVRTAVKKTVEDWKEFLDGLDIVNVGISQYKSHYFQHNNIREPDAFALFVLNQLRKCLAEYYTPLNIEGTDIPDKERRCLAEKKWFANS